MSRLYLIRHGETEWNTLGKYQGKTDIPLTDRGKQQAIAIGKRMENKSINAIYSSDLSRAYETAKQINRYHHVALYQEKGLREIDFGEWEGYTMKELEEIYGKQYTDFYREPHSFAFPGEGSFDNVRIRAEKIIEKIKKNHLDQDIAVVAHGGIIKMMIIVLMGWDMKLYKQFWLGNTSLSIIDLKSDGKNVLCLLNDICHLQNE